MTKINNIDFIILQPEDPTVVGFRDLVDTRKDEITGIDPESPWSETSLLAAEQSYIQLSESEADHMKALYEAFLGEGLVRLYGGNWVRLTAHVEESKPSHGYGIHYGSTDHVDVVTSLLPLARRIATGSHWAALYASTAQFLNRRAI
jgi:hypothetical protein